MLKYRLLILLFLTGFIANLSAAVHQYQIEIDEKIAFASVKICFDGLAPQYLAVEGKKGNRDLKVFPKSHQGSIEIQGRFWKTGNLPENACLSYKINIERHHAKRTKQSAGRKNIAYIEDNTWLWLPEVMDDGDDIELLFKLPEWAEISTPWKQVNFNEHRFLLGGQPQEWGYTLLLGDFNVQHSLISKGHYLNITSLKGMKKSAEINRWLTDIAKALNGYLGDYPVDQTQIIVIPKSKPKSGPVPWGDFSRGNGFGIRFVVVPQHDLKDFYADWTATHEFSHQLLPKIHYDDIWLSEGLSSYLQYVLMAQSGVLSTENAWGRIYKGFQRGEKGANKIADEPLYLTSGRRSHGGRSGRTMRIYWSGALYFFKADIALRQLTKDQVGLNDILLELNRCCLEGDKIWRGSELAEQLDKLSESKIFGELYTEFANSTKFPEYESLFLEIGVSLPTHTQLEVKIKPNSLAHKIMKE